MWRIRAKSLKPLYKAQADSRPLLGRDPLYNLGQEGCRAIEQLRVYTYRPSKAKLAPVHLDETPSVAGAISYRAIEQLR